MNYIVEILAFYDWLETNSIASSAIALWHALMSIANKTRWQPEFAVAMKVLIPKTGLKKDAIENARNILAQKGRIKWKSRDGNQSAVYEIIPFVTEIPSQNAAQYAAQSTAQSPSQPPAQDTAINKQNNTKQDNDNSTCEDEQPVKKFIPPTIEEVQAYCVSRNNGIDAEHFVSHYKARDWILSNGKKMKDWKSAVITWEKNNAKFNGGKNASSGDTGYTSPNWN